MLHPQEMTELLIATYGPMPRCIRRASACLLQNAEDHAGAHEWSAVASAIWQVISAWTEAAEAGSMH